MRAAALFSALVVFALPALARAQAGPPAAHEDSAWDFMNVLRDHGLHDINDESWNAYGQLTFIHSYKSGFSAPYTNENGSNNSLLTKSERSFTGSATLFFGLKLWPGGEAYLVPEVIAERPLSGLHGLGGSIQNFELQKTGSETPQLYRSRTFLRQTIDLSGDAVVQASQPMQLASKVKSRRLVITAGNFSVLDVFDRSAVSWDPRQDFLNMAFMTYSSWDFPADARGYSWGATAELYWDDWTARLGRITPPQNPNSLATDFRLWKYYGDELEIEHDHKIKGRAGSVRIVGYRNRVDTGNFNEAVNAFEADPSKNAAACGTLYNYNSKNPIAPDLCWVRKPNVKVGIGIHLEQYLADGIGVFARAMYSDGQTEVDAFNPADRSFTIGAVGKGGLWKRPFDVVGGGYGASWISSAHARYLKLGGVDGFVGDGNLTQAAEQVLETFYSVNMVNAVWTTLDYQFIWNPGFNADRGPAHVLGMRIHAEF